MRDRPQTPARVLGGPRFPTKFLYTILVCIILGGFLVPAASRPAPLDPFQSAPGYLYQHGFDDLAPQALKAWIDSIDINTVGEVSPITFDEPVPGSLYPKDMASPGFLWSIGEAVPKVWLLRFGTKTADLSVLVNRPWWVPLKSQWEHFKSQFGFEPVTLNVYGIGGWSLREVVASGQTSFSISPDPVASKLAFIRKPLPFRKAKENPQLSQLLLGDVGSYEPPRVVLKNQSTCFNCHGFSAGRNVLGLDMDVGGDKGGYIVKPVRSGVNWVVDAEVISWNRMPAPAPAKTNMGLFARPSPDGRHIAATIGESSVFVMLDDIYFSQLFFPASGRIACYDRNTRKMFALPGADAADYVQTGPAWSPDGKMLYFARARIRDDLLEAIESGQIRNESSRQPIQALNERYPIQFDIYRVPFNGGRGGTAQPLAGASHNGASNYFPRVSPDGRWIVFTRSPTGMVLQPDSRLYILPAAGGRPRLLGCETSIMNSWHSWSANGRWLAYSTKVQSPFTEIFLTHIDDRGNASPAIRLFRFSSPDAAAMVPEFVPATAEPFESLQMKSARRAGFAPAAGDVR